MRSFASCLLRGLCAGMALCLITGWNGTTSAADTSPRQIGLEMGKPWKGDFDAMIARRLVRILVPYSKTLYFLDKGRQYGTVVELARALEKSLNEGNTNPLKHVTVALVPMARDRLFAALNEGLGDIAAGSLTITPERERLVDFTSPIASDVKEVVVTGASAPPFTRIEDLAGRELYLRKSSSYYEHIEALNGRFQAQRLGPVKLVAADEVLEDEDLLEMVSVGLLPYAVVDEPLADLWFNVLPNILVRKDLVINNDGNIAWAIRKNSPQLKAVLDKFVEGHRIGTTVGNILKKRYYTSDRMARKAFSQEGRRRLQDVIGYFRQNGKEFGFEYLLLAAQGYQESELDQTKISPRGAVGVMQLLPTTAADKDIGVPDIGSSAERNIHAGVKYLRHLIKTYIDDIAVDDRNRLLFAFAAYNAGPRNLRRFRDKAKELGLNPNVWFGNVENGAAATVGRETVQYVSNIYKYYVAYALAVDLTSDRESAMEAIKKSNQ